MPTKGPARAHEAITLTPSHRHLAPTSAAPDGRPEDGQGEPSGQATPDSEQVEGQASTRSPVRTYQGEQTEVEVLNVTAARQAAREAGEHPSEVAVTVRTEDGAQVSGSAGVRWRGGLRYEVDASQLVCDRHPRPSGWLAESEPWQPCQHLEHSVEATQALLEARRIRPALADFDRATRDTAATLAGEHEASLAAQHTAGPRPDGSAWATNPAAFQGAYRAARDRHQAGQAAVPYMTRDATGGLGAREGGRAFGVELEFDIEPGRDRAAALAAIGRELHAAGLTSSPHQSGYHTNRRNAYQQWSLESDSTVAGEIVSPVMYDEARSWGELQTVCDIVRRHGGQASVRCGGHVHVGMGDYDHTVDNHNRLLGLFHAHEDTLYRLAQNPGARAHRGTYWCRPNRVPAAGYRTLEQVRAGNASHGLGLNFESVAGHDTDHVEFRMWDASLDPGVIQTQIKLSLALTDAALRGPRPPSHHEQVGSHRQANGGLQAGERLGGEAWRRDTASFRGLMDRLFWRSRDKEQAAALFAVTRWQRATR